MKSVKVMAFVVHRRYSAIDGTSPTYDADGNMTADERGWCYVWNGENRLNCASNSECM